jgi:TRIAD3 protein (E3 ubiquitin-protein ligase RNF216)
MEELGRRMRTYQERKDARDRAEKTHSTLQCMCCFSDCAFEEMISCREEGHLFCVDCLRHYAESQIFGSGNLGVDRKTKEAATELLCMHGDGCSSGFDSSALRKALPARVLEKYDELQFQAVVSKAGVENLW